MRSTADQKPKCAERPHFPADPPIKHFAQRHTYLGTDTIAARDLRFSMAGHQPVMPSQQWQHQLLTAGIEDLSAKIVLALSLAYAKPRRSIDR